ncbi:MAG: ABC transporter ATP-binding protein [Acidobacteria bacterium]|nr:ABC transporter ATP-binding protein [Candidatus Sulfomarinibacter kjeldsenii]
MNAERLIEIEELSVGFPTSDNGWRNVVDGVTLNVGAGERVGLVGESGSGKSITALACLGLVPEPGRVTGGSVSVGSADIAMMSGVGLNRLRGREIGIILQEAVEALNPVYTVGFQVTEAIAVHRGLGHRDAYREALSLLSDAALEAPEEIARAYPHELSGGQAQRVMLALSLAGRPRILIADEPTSALDLLTQAQVIELLDHLVEERGMGLLLISHDLVVVKDVVDRVAIMFEGRIVEEGPTETVFSSPRHPYTRMLLASAPGRMADSSDEEVKNAGG